MRFETKIEQKFNAKQIKLISTVDLMQKFKEEIFPGKEEKKKVY